MSQGRVIAEIRSADGLDGLMDALRLRIAELGISQATVDVLGGFCDGYTSKLLSSKPAPRTATYRPTARGLGSMSLPVLMGAVGIKLLVVEDHEALAKVKANRNFVARKSPPNRPMLTVDKHNDTIITITRETFVKMSAKAAEARKKKIPNWKRQAIARKAARARWRAKPPAKGGASPE